MKAASWQTGMPLGHSESGSPLVPEAAGCWRARGCKGGGTCHKTLPTNSTAGTNIFIKINFSNSFNSVRRDVIMEAVQRHIPKLLPAALRVIVLL